MYTTSEVAEILRVNPRTVSRWRVNGKLKYIRLPGGHYRYSKQSVDALKRESQ